MQRGSRTVATLGLLAMAGCATPPPKPRVDGVSPAIACLSSDLDESLVITGNNLGPSVVDGLGERPRLVGPSLRLNRRLDLDGGPAEGEDIVLQAGDPRLAVRSAERLEVRLDRFLGLQSGRYDLSVQAAGAQPAALPDALAVLGPPADLHASPSDFCQGGDSVTLALQGAGLLRVDGVLPTVQFADSALTLDGVEDCTPLPQDPRVEVCSSATLSFSPDTLPTGVYGLSLLNPSPGDCAESAPVALSLRPAPTLSAVSPGAFCDTGTTLTLEGAGLVPDMEAQVGGVALGPVEWIDSRTARLFIPDGALSPGIHDLALSSAGGCDAVLAGAVDVRVPPVTFAVDPPVVPQGRSQAIRASLAGVFDAITSVTLTDEAGTSVFPDWSWDPEDPAAVQILLPDSLHAGTWRVTADQGADCPGTPSATVEVLDADDLPLESVEPAQAWAFAPTAIEVSLVDPLPTSAVGLQPGARAWLVDAAGLAAPVRVYAAEARSETLLSGIVPEGLDTGVYGLLVLNPDGTAGLLDDALEVVALEPPAIESVSPGTLENRGSPPLRIQGAGFRDPTVRLDCRDGGTRTLLGSTRISASYGEVVVAPDVTAVAQAVCVVELENADGAKTRFSAVSITNPAQNLFPWQTGPALNTARRAPAAVAGRTSSVRRWLYAIGGDDGAASGALQSIEIAPVGVFGDLGEWRRQPRDLPEARSLAGIVRIEDFLYLVGGSDPVAATQSTLRAQILDPLSSPWFTEIGLEPGETGLDPGTWSYRVAARFPPDDPSNPDGEGLAADLVVVTVPDTGDPWAIHLSWAPVPGAVAYRLYRSPDTAAVPGLEEALLVEVATPSFTDTGASVDPGTPPLVEGDLGEWAEVAPLTLPRRSPCVTTAADPFPDPNVVYIYAAGGAGADGSPTTASRCCRSPSKARVARPWGAGRPPRSA